MAEFQVRSDAVDVEQIMRQIRARIREKRGADYTEQEIRELASVKLEKFLDPRGVRSNLVEEFRRNRVVSPAPKTVGIGNIDVYGSPRAAIRGIRRLLNPILRLFFSPTPLVHAVNSLTKDQNEINAEVYTRFRQREEMDPLYYEVIHNLVVELTRLSIENSNLKMRVESLSSRMDFDERRARALETVVQYKPAPKQPDRPQADRSQPDRPQADRSQSDRPQADRSHGDRQQSDRPQGDRQHSDRQRGDRGQSDRSQSDRSHGERAQNAAPPAGQQNEQAQPQGDRSPNDPQRAGLEPRDQGERGERRRRRRRRRRPGQNMANGPVQGPGSPVQGPSGAQGAGASVQSPVPGSDSDGDYDGPDDDGGDGDDAADNSSDASEQAAPAPTVSTAQSNHPIADSPMSNDQISDTNNQITSSPDNQIQDPEGSGE
jgi:hypothetical protein